MFARFYSQYYSNFDLFILNYIIKEGEDGFYDIIIEKTFENMVIEYSIIKGFSNSLSLAIEFAHALSDNIVTPGFIEDCYSGCMRIALEKAHLNEESAAQTASQSDMLVSYRYIASA